LGFRVQTPSGHFIAGLETWFGDGMQKLDYWVSSEFENNYFTEMCSGSEAGSYLRLIYFVFHSTQGLRVIKKKGRLDYWVPGKLSK